MEAKKGKATCTRDVPTGSGSTETTQVKALLQEQRKSLLNSLKSDLPAYLNYKFTVVLTESQLDQIRAAFAEFEQSVISESLCRSVLKDGLLGYNSFYHEINLIISRILHPAHVELGINSGKGKDGVDVTDLGALPMI